MDDYERYGDYNEIEYDAPKSKNPFIIILKLLVAIVCIGVVGIIAFRLTLFNSYPDSMKRIHFNEALTEYYRENGVPVAKTQVLGAPYDDPDLGRFFCDYLVVVEDAEQLQITVRYNVSTLETIAEDLELTEALDPDSKEHFTFRLRDNYGNVYENVEVVAYESSFMYRYMRLVFDEVRFKPNEAGEYPEWIRLEINPTLYTTDEPYSMIVVYENNSRLSAFSEYRIKEEELPK